MEKGKRYYEIGLKLNGNLENIYVEVREDKTIFIINSLKDKNKLAYNL